MNGNKTLELSDSELQILAMLTGLGASAFDVPGGIANQVKRRVEEKHKFIITTDDIINLLKKIENLR